MHDFRSALALLALGAVSGCGQVIGLEDMPCEPGCTPEGERIFCENGAARTEACSSTTRCAAGDCVAPAISALNCTTCATRIDGSVWCWGSNQFGQLGDVAYNDGTPVRIAIGPTRDVSVGQTHVCAVTDSHEVYCWGSNELGQSDPAHPSSKNVVAPARVFSNAESVSAGALHTCALTLDHDVYCWGSNHAGQCGQRRSPPLSKTPIAALACGYPDSLGAVPSSLILGPTRVQLPKKAGELVVQKNTTCALVEGEVYCWGSNCGGPGKGDVDSIDGNSCTEGGQLGEKPTDICYADGDDLVPMKRPNAYWSGVGLGNIAGFAFDTPEGRLFAWGWREEQLGTGDLTGDPKYVPPATPVKTKDGQLDGVLEVIRSNGWHTFALTVSGYYSWGQNTCGELGRKDALTTGNQAIYPYAARADIVPKGVTRFATGQDHACFIDELNRYFCFGNGYWIGQQATGMPLCGWENDKLCGQLSTTAVEVKFH